jgi:hypothetical protein
MSGIAGEEEGKRGRGRGGLQGVEEQERKRGEEEGACMEWKSRRGGGEEEEGACKGGDSRVEFSARVLQGCQRAANG